MAKPEPLTLPEVLDRLERRHGKPRRPLPRTALDWVLWENAAYLVPDERRARAFQALKQRTGLTAGGILALPREQLHELAQLGGMLAEGRVGKLLEIADLVQDEFAGDLESVLVLPLPKARRALQRFPGIGRPGADKILLFTRTHALAALESNGLRALVRVGLAREGKSYAITYRSALAAFEPHLERGCPWLMRAHQLLRVHGQELCKNSETLCDACPLADRCPSAC